MKVCLKPGCNVDLSTETGVMGCYIFINNGPGKLPRRVPTGELMCIEHGKDGGNMMSREAFNAMVAENRQTELDSIFAEFDSLQPLYEKVRRLKDENDYPQADEIEAGADSSSAELLRRLVELLRA